MLIIKTWESKHAAKSYNWQN